MNSYKILILTLLGFMVGFIVMAILFPKKKDTSQIIYVTNTVVYTTNTMHEPLQGTMWMSTNKP